MARNSLAHDVPYIWDNRYLVFNGQMVHRIVWEEAKGSIPPGMLIHHKNGNRFDNRIDNLELITKAEHCKLHKPRIGYRSPPKPIICKYCGEERGERDLINNPHHHKCSKCRTKEYKQRKELENVPSI